MRTKRHFLVPVEELLGFEEHLRAAERVVQALREAVRGSIALELGSDGAPERTLSESHSASLDELF